MNVIKVGLPRSKRRVFLIRRAAALNKLRVSGEIASHAPYANELDQAYAEYRQLVLQKLAARQARQIAAAIKPASSNNNKGARL